MMRRLAAFILILGSLQGFLFQEIQVFQVPVVHATPSSDATLPCTYNISEVEAIIGTYKWYRHLVRYEPDESESNKDFTGRISRVNTDLFINTTSAQITIHNVILSDTGYYYCEVTFLHHGGKISGHGAGTLLNVTGFLSQEIQVFQVPEVHATPSSDVILPCTYYVSGFEDTTIGSYKWYRHQVKTGPEVSDSNKDFFGRISRTNASEFMSKRIAHLTIHNVDSSHTGIYFCQVTFQHGKEISGHGNGTLLNVTDDSQKTFGICILVKAAGFLLIVLTLLIAFMCRFIFRPTNINHFNQHSGSPGGACGSPAVLTQSLSQ